MGKEVKLRQGWADVESLLSESTTEFVVATATDELSTERVATDTATIDVDTGTAGQMKWNVIAPLPVDHGGTGQTTALAAAAALVGMAKLASGTVSNQAALDLALDDAGYSSFKVFKLFLWGVLPATDIVALYMRFSDDGGATFEADASDYSYVGSYKEDDTDEFLIADTADSEITIAVSLSNVAGELGAFEITIFNPAAAERTQVTWSGAYTNDSDTLTRVNGAGRALVASASTDVRILAATGNITLNYTLMGIV